MDMISWKLMISQAMAQFLGISGQSIAVDILHVGSIDSDSSGAWIRVPESDLSTVWSGLSGAQSVVDGIDVSIRVVRASRYLQGLESRHW